MINGQIRTNDVFDQRILDAIAAVPRETFVPESVTHLAYSDACVPLGGGRVLLDPRTFAKLLQLANLERTDLVLDIAPGTGYSSAVLGQLCDAVVSVEEDPDLVKSAERNLGSIDVTGTVKCVQARHADGHPGDGPYDVIFVNGAITEPPEAWAQQLKSGGKLLAVVNHGPTGRARLFVKDGTSLMGRDAFDATLPLLPGFQRPQRFAF